MSIRFTSLATTLVSNEDAFAAAPRVSATRTGVTKEGSDGKEQRRAGAAPGCTFVSIRWAVRVCDWRPSVKEFRQALSMTNEVESKRIMRFRFFEDAKRSLLGRLLIRKLCRDIM
mmetsp:Transcript_15538/g.38328  ORF Transcript_15538/g.38328 Transcript_15538/m.38328 type:complete len:115 (+) Transcript_15538:57-401(+)